MGDMPLLEARKSTNRGLGLRRGRDLGPILPLLLYRTVCAKKRQIYLFLWESTCIVCVLLQGKLLDWQNSLLQIRVGVLSTNFLLLRVLLLP